MIDSARASCLNLSNIIWLYVSACSLHALCLCMLYVSVHSKSMMKEIGVMSGKYMLDDSICNGHYYLSVHMQSVVYDQK